MGGMVGALSGKFIFNAGMLLFAARLDMHATKATVDPTAAVTVISAELAKKLRFDLDSDHDLILRKVHVIGLDHAELRLRKVVVKQMQGPAQIIIGRDLLQEMAIRFDFPRARLRVFDNSERDEVGRGFTALETGHVGADGCITVHGLDEAHVSQAIAVTGNVPASGPAVMIKLGDATVPAYSNDAGGPCPGPGLATPWQSFRQVAVIFDLRSSHLFVAAN